LLATRRCLDGTPVGSWELVFMVDVALTYCLPAVCRFDISAAIKGVVATTASVFLDELLEDQSRHVNEVDMEQLVLNVNMLIHLLNTHFVRTK
jgi:hypothetical protein